MPSASPTPTPLFDDPDPGLAAPTPATGDRTDATPSTLHALRSTLPPHLRHQLRSARELARRQRRAEERPLATGVAALDRLLGGGLPRGRLVEIAGRGSSGRFSAVLAALAGVTGAGEAAALVDLGDALEPAAARAAGVELERLLWVRPRDVREALAAAETVLDAGFALVVLDLGAPPVPGGRGAEGAWVRLARAAESHRGALLVASPYRVSGTAASAVVRAGGRPAWVGGGAAPRLLDGLGSRLRLEKGRDGVPKRGEEGLDLLPLEALLAGRAAGAAAQRRGAESGTTRSREAPPRSGQPRPAPPRPTAARA